MSALAEGGIALSEFTEDSFLGSITVSGEKQTVLTTIPYDAGWQITVDGEKVEGYETLDALLAFDLSEGTHTVEMVYRPDCYVIGSIVSVVSVVLFLALIAIEFCVNRKYIRLREGGICRSIFDLLMSNVPVPEDLDPFADETMGISTEETEGKTEADDEIVKDMSDEADAASEWGAEDETKGE